MLPIRLYSVFPLLGTSALGTKAQKTIVHVRREQSLKEQVRSYQERKNHVRKEQAHPGTCAQITSALRNMRARKKCTVTQARKKHVPRKQARKEQVRARKDHARKNHQGCSKQSLQGNPRNVFQRFLKRSVRNKSV
jgi:hypothetical protein